MRRWAICPKYRRSTTPTIRSTDASTMAPAPSAMAPRLTPSSWKAGVSTSSVTRPSTTVPPTAITAKRVAPTSETPKGRAWARAESHSRRAPRRSTFWGSVPATIAGEPNGGRR